MPTVHIDAPLGSIKKNVLMPGDPLRAKYIADHFLEEVTQVNHTRGMLAYTGKYQGTEVTVFASGMGCPSMGIYAYELFTYYQVDTIIRIGTCGAGNSSLNLLDIVIADQSYSFSSFPELMFNDSSKEFSANLELNEKLETRAKEKKLSYHRGNIATLDVFDHYVDDKDYLASLYQKANNPIAVEMEAAALFALAKHLKKRAACLLSVVDSPYRKEVIDSKKRESSLNDMIVLALETIHNL